MENALLVFIVLSIISTCITFITVYKNVKHEKQPRIEWLKKQIAIEKEMYNQR